MYSQTKIAIPIAQKDKDSVIIVARDCIRKGADILEFRIDAMENPNKDTIVEIVKELDFPLIATCRIKEEGGSFEGSERDRVNLLLACAPYVEYIDIELQTNDEYIEEIKSTGVKTIISYHDFEKTPELSDLIYIVNKEKSLGDIAKVAVTPEELEDTLVVLAVLSRCNNTIAISMGELGSYTRVMASKFNSPITFAVGRDVTAPGQLDIETMKMLLNMDLIDDDLELDE